MCVGIFILAELDYAGDDKMVSEVSGLILQMLMNYKATVLKEVSNNAHEAGGLCMFPFCSFAVQCCFLGDGFIAETEKIPVVRPLKNEHVTRPLTSTVS